MKNLLLILFCVVCVQAMAQTETSDDVIAVPGTIGPAQEPDSNFVYSFAEEMPVFPGGYAAMTSYIQTNIIYPEKEKAEGKSGIVYVKFTVNKDGSITDVAVIKEVPQAPGLTTEALRVIRSMPKWTPGMVNGKPVRVAMNMPVKFTLPSEPVKKQ